MNTTIQQWLRDNACKLPVTDTAKLDADLLLCHVLGVSRSHLFAWPEQVISEPHLATLDTLLQRRANREPMAYILGRREFWSIELAVDEHVLIPRPETEGLVEIATNALNGNRLVGNHTIPAGPILDAGTGSGAIAIAIAKHIREHNNTAANVFASDLSPHALEVAAKNAASNGESSIQFVRTDWLSTFNDNTFAMIISNPPYLASNDKHLTNTEISHEPRAALVSGADGLNAIGILVDEAVRVAKPGALIALEHGHTQGNAVRQLMRAKNYQQIKTQVDLASLERITYGICPPA